MVNYVKSDFKKLSLAKILLFSGALISILWSVYFAVVTISMPYQIEFREGTAQVLTQLLLNRSNPFALENQPLAMNNYGLGYNLAVLPFAILFGNTLQVYRSVTFAFILLTVLTSFLAVYKVKRDPFLGLACGAFVMIGLMGYGGIGAFPSAMGTFLFLLAVLILFFRSFDYPGLVLSSLLSILAFYTKPYFLLAFGIVASYLFLFISKKKGAMFSLLFMFLFAVSFIVVRKFFPLYFIDTVAGNVSNTHLSIDHLFSQLAQLFLYFYHLVILSLAMLGLDYFRKRKKGEVGQIKKIIINFFVWNRPLIEYSVNYFLYFGICSFLAFAIILGPHTGDYLNFAYQLVVPSFCAWFFQKYNPGKKTGIIFALLVVFNLYIWESVQLNPQMLDQRNSKAWAELYSYIKPTTSILNSPVVTANLVEAGMAPLDSGQTQYFFDVKRYPDNRLIGPPYDTFKSNGVEYVKLINDSIEKQKFDLVLTTAEKVPFIHLQILHANYSQFKEIIVDMPQTNEQWTVAIWKPLTK